MEKRYLEMWMPLFEGKLKARVLKLPIYYILRHQQNNNKQQNFIDYKYIEDITRWREDMNFIFEPPCNVLFII